MMDKLLCIKHDNNIVLYKVSFDETSMKKYIDELKNKYTYKEKQVIETRLYHNIPLNMGKYDYLNNCHIEGNYKILKARKINENNSIGEVEITVKYDSAICNALEEVFMDEGVLMNMTSYYKLINHIYRFNNNFIYDEVVDHKQKKKKWNDPGRLILNDRDIIKSDEFKMKELNRDDIELNEEELKDQRNIFYELLNKIDSEDVEHSIIKSYEQVGMFPIEENYDNELRSIFTSFGRRNEGYEKHFGKIETSKKFLLDFDGGQYIRSIADTVLETYKPKKETPKNKEKYSELIKSRLKIS